MAESLRWLVFGAGAIGTYIGGSLALQEQRGKSPQRVVFLERPDVAAQIRQRRLRLKIDGVEYATTSPGIAGSLDEALAQGPFDLGIFALKSYDTQAALAGLIPYIKDLPPILCLQNGVENEAILAEALGIEKVLAGTVTSAVGRIAAGDIVLEKRRGLGIAAGHRLAEAAVRALNEAGLNTRLYPRAADMKWSKMLTNLLANASCAILDMTPVEVLQNPAAYRLEAAVQREALSVMKTLGIAVVDLPGTPVRLLALGMQRLPPALARPLIARFAGQGRGAKMPSFHIDLYSGRKQSEVDFLNGAVVRLGRQAGIATPANQLLNETLLRLTRGDLPLDAFSRQPEKLLRLYRNGA
jgi:2-dehydropantoate 2-reductase